MGSKRITDSSISELTSVADDDFLYVMDVSDTTGGVNGTSKRIKSQAVTGGTIAANNVAAAPSDPIPAAGSAGALTGTYSYKVTFVTADGETDAQTTNSPTVTVTSQRINVSNIEVSPDPRVTARKLYRTVANPADTRKMYLVATIADNTTTTYVDNNLDSALGLALPGINQTAGRYFANGQQHYALIGNCTAFGRSAIETGRGYASVAVGFAALNSSNSALRATTVGVYALTSLTEGDENVGVGCHAGNDATTGSRNTYVGYAAGFQNVTGSDNTGIGHAALSVCKSVNNTAVGRGALQVLDGGYNNTAIGIYSGWQTVTGAGNCFAGYGSSYNATSGDFNALYGMETMAQPTSGSFHTGIGPFALRNCASGQTSNLALGAYAGYYETGSYKVWIDNRDRGSLANSEAQSLIVGQTAATPADQTLRVNADLGINTDPHPAAAIDVVSTTKGIKLPVMTQSQRDAISSPPEGLMVYDSDFGGLWIRGQFSSWYNYRVTFNLANFFDAAWLDLNEATGSGGNKVRLTVPASLSADYTATLPAMNGTVVVGPGTTTVGSLGSASPAGRRGFVTDANATTFNSVVAGGGANFVPVFSDGTNWRIG